jgi:hypothetical protein
MRRLSSLAVMSLLFLSTSALAEPPSDATGAGSVTEHLAAQAQSTAPKVVASQEVPPPNTSTPGEVQLGKVVKLFAQAVASRN